MKKILIFAALLISAFAHGQDQEFYGKVTANNLTETTVADTLVVQHNTTGELQRLKYSDFFYKLLNDLVDDGTLTQGSGDMLKSVYDTNDDGSVHDADSLGGYFSEDYARLDRSQLFTGFNRFSGGLRKDGTIAASGIDVPNLYEVNDRIAPYHHNKLTAWTSDTHWTGTGWAAGSGGGAYTYLGTDPITSTATAYVGVTYYVEIYVQIFQGGEVEVYIGGELQEQTITSAGRYRYYQTITQSGQPMWSLDPITNPGTILLNGLWVGSHNYNEELLAGGGGGTTPTGRTIAVDTIQKYQNPYGIRIEDPVYFGENTWMSFPKNSNSNIQVDFMDASDIILSNSTITDFHGLTIKGSSYYDDFNIRRYDNEPDQIWFETRSGLFEPWASTDETVWFRGDFRLYEGIEDIDAANDSTLVHKLWVENYVANQLGGSGGYAIGSYDEGNGSTFYPVGWDRTYKSNGGYGHLDLSGADNAGPFGSDNGGIGSMGQTWGWDNRNKGYNNLVSGYGNETTDYAYSQYNLVGGTLSKASRYAGLTWGTRVENDANYSWIGGIDSKIGGGGLSFVFGIGLDVDGGDKIVAFGQNNIRPQNSGGNIYSFLIGNGTVTGDAPSGYNRVEEESSDAFRVYRSGRIEAPDFDLNKYGSQYDLTTVEKVSDMITGVGGGIPEAPIDGNIYGRQDAAWTQIGAGGGSVAWGDITGTLSAQTDLQSVLNQKLDSVGADPSPWLGGDLYMGRYTTSGQPWQGAQRMYARFGLSDLNSWGSIGWRTGTGFEITAGHDGPQYATQNSGSLLYYPLGNTMQAGGNYTQILNFGHYTSSGNRFYQGQFKWLEDPTYGGLMYFEDFDNMFIEWGTRLVGAVRTFLVTGETSISSSNLGAWGWDYYLDNTTNYTLTLTNAYSDLLQGDEMKVWQGNTGTVTIAAGTNVTLVNPSGVFTTSAIGQGFNIRILEWTKDVSATYLIEPIGGSGGGGTDDQTLSWNDTTNELSIENGNTVDLSGLAGASNPTNLSYDPATRTIASSTGTNAVLPIVGIVNPGLMTPALLSDLEDVIANNTGDQDLSHFIRDDQNETINGTLTTNGLYLGHNQSLYLNYSRIYNDNAGTHLQTNGSDFYIRNAYGEQFRVDGDTGLTLSQATNAEIDASDGSTLITKDWFNANNAGGGGGELNVQSDWNETDTNSDAYILNKPTTITQAQADAIVLNTAKVGITTTQANNILTNNAKVSFPEAPVDGQQYARQNGNWTVVSGGGTGDITGVDITATGGLQGSVTTTVGTHIQTISIANSGVLSNHIIDNGIKEIDLNVSNAPINNAFLTMNTSTGGFTWRSLVGGTGIDVASNVISLGTLTEDWEASTTYAIKSAGFYEISMRALKTNIQPFTKKALDLVNSLNIVTYDKVDGNIKDKVGVIIEETPEEFANEEQTAVDLYNTIFIQAKAIQELTEKIESLEKRVNELEKEHADGVRSVLTNGE